MAAARWLPTRALRTVYTRASPGTKRLIPCGGRVAVIGAGAAGLSAARSLRDHADGTLRIEVFESAKCVGGTWKYDPETGPDKHSSMYKNLRTNIPKETMPFLDFPFDSKLPSYVGHSDVQDYLVKFAEKYDLNKLIHFGARVERVERSGGERGGWRLVWKSESKGKGALGGKAPVVSDGSSGSSAVYDAVFVCNGHYTHGVYPSISGLDGFRGTTVHSRDYRENAPFAGKRVAVIGGGPSGVDISVEIARVAKQVYRSERAREKPEILKEQHVEAIPDVCEISSDGRACWRAGAGGETEPLDSIVMCTGYDYSFPFLSRDIGVSVSERGVRPLWRHLYFTQDPTLVFVGLPWRVAPFLTFECQTRHAAAYLTGRATTSVLSTEQMEAERKEEERVRLEQFGLPRRYYHMFGGKQWEYQAGLAAEARAVIPQHKAVELIYRDSSSARKTDVVGYRNRNYRLFRDDDKVQSENGDAQGQGKWKWDVQKSGVADSKLAVSR